MSETIKVRFKTRRDADLALEHLVQEYAVDRTDIFISAAGNDNSVGSEAAGADVESGHPNERAEGEPALAGDIELSVDVNDARAPSLRQALAELGPRIVTERRTPSKRATRKTAFEQADIAIVDKLEPVLDHPAVEKIANVGKIADEPPLLVVSGALLAIGLFSKNPKLTRSAGSMMLAHGLAIAIKNLGKNTIDRTRPSSTRMESATGWSREVPLPRTYALFHLATPRAQWRSRVRSRAIFRSIETRLMPLQAFSARCRLPGARIFRVTLQRDCSSVPSRKISEAGFSGICSGGYRTCSLLRRNVPKTMIRIGTAGWAIPASVRKDFSNEGSGLARYSSRFSAVEINSSFYRSHRPSTYARWSASVPDEFRFSVKVPKTITHERRLFDCDEQLSQFLVETSELGDKIGPMLVQLPPSLGFDTHTANMFFAQFRDHYSGQIVCEPRHGSWFTPEAEELFLTRRIARAAADPAPVSDAARPGGFGELAYFRLHGSPSIYRSAYGQERLRSIAVDALAVRSQDCWIMFDNTASGAAAADALLLSDIVQKPSDGR